MNRPDRLRRFTQAWGRLEQRGLFERLADASLTATAHRLEAEAYASPDLGIFLSVIATCGLAAPILHAVGRALPAGSVMAVAITEPEAGSDAQALQTTLTPEGSGFRLSGTKWCITNAPVASHFIVFCREATTARLTAVWLERDRAGLEIGAPLDIAGAYSSPTGGFVLRNVRVDRADVLGDIGDGQRLMFLAFLRERLLAPWPLLGAAARVLQQSFRHVSERHQFGAPLASQQHVQARIVAAYEDYASVRALSRASLLAVGAAAELHASLVKRAAARMAEHVFREALAVHGSYGLLESCRYGEYLQDALCSSIAGGTSELHQRVVFDALAVDALRVERGHASAAFPTFLAEPT